MKFYLLIFGLIFSINSVIAAPKILWSDVSSSTQASKTPELDFLPDKYRLLYLDENGMRNELTALSRSSQRSSTSNQLLVPLPNGETLLLYVEDNNTMSPELAAKFPNIKTYKVNGNDNNGIYGSIDFTEAGFHAMLFLADGSRLFIDPRTVSAERVYISYYTKDYHPANKPSFICNNKDHDHSRPSLPPQTSIKENNEAKRELQRTGDTLETYRLAMAATGEYTTFHGGTVPLALSAIVTTVNRVNVIYQRDLAATMQLVGNTNLLIYTNSATDPYTNNSGGTMLGENQNNIDNVIGTANYDIGHAVSTGGGGIATLQSVCNPSSKARGITGTPSPIGDAFDIDFVAHEMGHQFGGNHTFNSTTGSCGGGNRSGANAFEPGSGTTIQAYAGICGPTNNTQPHTDAMFHSKSIEEMSVFINGFGSCGANTSLSNTQPTADAKINYRIPPSTPFELTGIGSDSDMGDVLTYSWEQINAGTATDINVVAVDNAIFRTFLPKTTPTRIFPTLSHLLAGTVSKGETLPNIARSMNFSFTVRDGHGGVATDNLSIQVVSSPPFQITSHTTSSTLVGGTNTMVTWEEGTTNVAPINCGYVDISLSTDGGNSFSNISDGITLNDGSETVLIPASIANSTTARLKVKCSNNIFFDISDTDLTTQPSSTLDLLNFTASNTGSNGAIDPGEVIDLTVALRNHHSTNNATAVSGVLSSTDTGINIINANSNYPDIPSTSFQNNTTAYKIFIPSNHACMDIPATLTTNFNITGATSLPFDFTIPMGTTTSFSPDNSALVAIPDNNSTGINSTIQLQGMGTIIKPHVSVDVNITHTYRGDIKITLTSPQATTVTLKLENSFDKVDNIFGNYPNTLVPFGDLSAFDGENFDGTWTLNVSDNFESDTGTLDSWNLNFSKKSCVKENQSFLLVPVNGKIIMLPF